MEFRGQSFAGQTVRTDGNLYVECDFDGAQIEFAGGEMPRFERCNYGTGTFVFVDAAERTINFLRGLGGLGTAGSELVRKVLNLPF